MPQPLATQTLAARRVFPATSPPIERGYVTIAGERTVEVGAGAPPGAIDLGDVAILPGLVNAHTHLEFSDLDAPLGQPGMSLPHWIREVVAARRARNADATAAIARGLAESARAGTTTLGEIATSGWTAESLRSAPLDLTAFYEVIGLAAARVPELLEQARGFVARLAEATGWRGGLSPHAPYSVHPELVVALARLAAAHDLPVAMHLAESREEIELLAEGTGPFRDMLVDFDAWDPAAIDRGTRPIQYLRILAEAPRALVIHGNYLDDEEIAFVAARSSHMSIVYCPRTHAYFGHAPYPLEKLLAAGATVALGTDSRASNPDLSVLEEMRLVARRFPDIPRDAVLRLGTINAAQALGCASQAGSLEAGKLANLAIVALESPACGDAHEQLFNSDLPVVATYYRGAETTRG